MKNRLRKWTMALLCSVLFVGIGFAQDQTPGFQFAPIADNPVLVPGASGAWDAVSVRFPQIVFRDGTYYLFYGTFQSLTQPVSIGYATSQDGDHWTKFDGNPVLSGDQNGFDASGVTRPVVFVETDGTWVMYYDGLARVNQVFGTGIGRATAPSPAGPWTRSESPVLQSGTGHAWDAGFLFPDSVIYTESGYVMYYSAGFSVGRATSPDGITWTKDADPVLKPAVGQWDSAIAWGSSVRLTDHGWEMFYYGDKITRGDPESILATPPAATASRGSVTPATRSSTCLISRRSFRAS